MLGKLPANSTATLRLLNPSDAQTSADTGWSCRMRPSGSDGEVRADSSGTASVDLPGRSSRPSGAAPARRRSSDRGYLCAALVGPGREVDDVLRCPARPRPDRRRCCRRCRCFSNVRTIPVSATRVACRARVAGRVRSVRRLPRRPRRAADGGPPAPEHARFSASSVSGPMIPVGVSPCCCWKLRTRCE